jgi:hypothetical protein
VGENIIDLFELIGINPDFFIQKLREDKEIIDIEHDREKGEITVISRRYGKATVKYKRPARGTA